MKIQVTLTRNDYQTWLQEYQRQQTTSAPLYGFILFKILLGIVIGMAMFSLRFDGSRAIASAFIIGIISIFILNTFIDKTFYRRVLSNIVEKAVPNNPLSYQLTFHQSGIGYQEYRSMKDQTVHIDTIVKWSAIRSAHKSRQFISLHCGSLLIPIPLNKLTAEQQHSLEQHLTQQISLHSSSLKPQGGSD